MSELHEKSVAFQQALLKSERLRILIFLGAIGAAFVTQTIRTIIPHSPEDLHLWFLTFLLIALFIGYESLMLRAVNHAIQTGGNLKNATWISTIIVESCLPALAVAFLWSASVEPAYRPLANPAVLVFFLVIILSTLRLNPMYCRVSGLVAAVSYLAAAAYLGWKPALGGGRSLLSPQKVVFSYAITLVVAGFVAGAVASEIRKQVNAALREAETRHQMERLEHDLEVARSIQQSLLPTSMPQIEGFDIAAWNQPADQTGGDYYDWQPLPDGKVLVALGDVTGHGIGSAMLAAVCRAYERANFTAENTLLTAMDRINALLATDMIEGRFVTFVAAVCSPKSSRVELLSAGQGPLFRYFLREDRFDKMEAQGLPLGISSILSSDPPLILELNPGDLLVLATDGFYEWANEHSEQFGSKRLEETIRASREKSFRSGAGMGWHEHDAGVFHGCEKFFRPGYAANLVSAWIPALHGVKEKLEAGARVADVGCGKGASTILMAKAFPKSRFFGFDYHDKSIEGARDSAKRQGVADRVIFEVAKAKEYPGKDYDLVAVFDCLHDMGDPVGASKHVRQSLGKDGTWMIVEPFANDSLEDNLNPVGRVYYSFSTLLCTPSSRSQEVGLCLGAQAGEVRIKKVATSAGFTHFRRAAETPFNIVYEARP